MGEEAENKRRLEEEEKRKKAELEKRESMFREVLDIDPEDTLASYGLGEIEYSKAITNYQSNTCKGRSSTKKTIPLHSSLWVKPFWPAERKRKPRKLFARELKSPARTVT